MSFKAESKDRDEKSCDFYDDDAKGGIDPVQIQVTSLQVSPLKSNDVSSGFKLEIDFNIDRDVIAGMWVIKFLVDLTNKRLIKILGETEVEDFMEGDNSMSFVAKGIDISDITPSTLANSALLMACLIADGEEVISINIVVNVTKNKTGELTREFLLPM
jgi:hypothetical protein